MKKLKILIGVVLSFSTAFIGMGYAQLSSNISLEATITGSMQKGGNGRLCGGVNSSRTR